MSLLERSLTGGGLAVAVILLRAIAINHLPKRSFLALWGVVLARLLLPYRIPLPVSVPLLQPKLPPAAVYTPVPNITVTVIQAVPDAPAPAPLAEGTAGSDLRPLLWAAGAAALALFFLVSYRKWRWVFRTSLPVENPFTKTWLAEHPLRRTISVRQSDRIAAPLTYGLLRPVILVPAALDWTDHKTLQYVFAHEYVHIRRFDAAVKLLLAGALCVHWFNPVVWVMYVLANRDMELSCDEAVVGQFGGGSKSRLDYVLALLAMEEQRSGLTHLNFSKNAMQERIEAIMKYKHASILALGLTAALVLGATTTFAAFVGPSSIEERDRRLNAEATVDEGELMSYVNPDDGKTYYSFDGGKTFEAMTDEEFERRFPAPNVEWWTYEEYAAWLEQEKINLQEMLGEKGWTGGRGEFIWTQEMIDETIALYEDILQEIKEGKMYSKSVDGSDDIMMSYNPADIATTDERDFAADRSIYEPFGLIWNEKDEKFYFKGEKVRYFYDGVELEDGAAVRREYLCDSGTVDVYTVWEPKDNGDGSYDPFGTLADVRAYSQEEFNNRKIASEVNPVQEATTTAYAQTLTEGKTFEEIFAQYKAYGVTYREGSVYYNGELVNCFADVSNTGTFFYESKTKGGGVNLRTVYDNAGKLTGVETFTGSIQLTEGGLSWPLSEYRQISTLFQGRNHPITGQKMEHTGLDISAPKDTPVLAAAAGAVTASGYDSKNGNYVLLSHGDGLETYYAHLTESSVKPGDTVTQGQTIGTVGSTGQSTGPHLHFEVRQDEGCQDPLNYFPNMEFKF